MKHETLRIRITIRGVRSRKMRPEGSRCGCGAAVCGAGAQGPHIVPHGHTVHGSNATRKHHTTTISDLRSQGPWAGAFTFTSRKSLETLSLSCNRTPAPHPHIPTRHLLTRPAREQLIPYPANQHRQHHTDTLDASAPRGATVHSSLSLSYTHTPSQRCSARSPSAVSNANSRVPIRLNLRT
jgi:hypothetical protein